MTPDRINSTGHAVLKSEKIENNTRSGNRYTKVVTGSLASMLAQRYLEQSAGASHIELNSLGDGNYEVVSEYPWDVINGSSSEAPVNSHELDESMEQTTIYNSPIVYSQLVASFGSNAGANGAMAFLMGANSAYQTAVQAATTAAAITAAAATAEALITSTYSGGQATLMMNLFRGIAYHQQTSAMTTKIVYNRRITAASFNQVQASFAGAGMIWTTAEVVAFEGTPAQWFFQLPAGSLWFKSNPKIVTVSDQKTEITYSYTSCVTAWSGSNVAYGAATLLSF